MKTTGVIVRRNHDPIGAGNHALNFFVFDSVVEGENFCLGIDFEQVVAYRVDFDSFRNGVFVSGGDNPIEI